MSSTRIPEVGSGKRGKLGHPAYLLRQAASAVRGALDRELKELGVTHPQFVVMVMLDAYPRASGAQLARLALLTPQTLTVILANLERGKLAQRRPSETNLRLVLYELTAKGSHVLARCKRVANRIETEMLASLSSAEAARALQWLSDLAVQFSA